MSKIKSWHTLQCKHPGSMTRCTVQVSMSMTACAKVSVLLLRPLRVEYGCTIDVFTKHSHYQSAVSLSQMKGT